MENQRREGVNVGEEPKGILKAVNRPRASIDSLIKKSIAQGKGLKYNPSSGNQVESSTREGGDHGII
jgi:hypothetical protein